MPPATITVAPAASSTRSYDGLAGGCPLTAEVAACLLVARGRLLAFVSSTCSGPRRLALMRSLVRCGTTSFDGACGNKCGRWLGLQRIVAGCSSMPEASQCGTTSSDGACDILGLLARRQLLLWAEATRGIRSAMEVSVPWRHLWDGPVVWASWRAWWPRAREWRSPTADEARPPRVVSCSGLVLFSVEWFCFEAAALRRRVLHGGDLFGGAVSTPPCFFSAPGHVVGSMSLGACWWARATVASSSR
jgi:hypothetical protein